ncbi:uncharacterized protein TNCV_376021 [Trichonephila clavipes]|nr:uncharacterized protein TNCV_376021 [Trichonephila clavipes]
MLTTPLQTGSTVLSGQWDTHNRRRTSNTTSPCRLLHIPVFLNAETRWLQQGGFSFSDIAERLGRNVSIVGSSGQGMVLFQDDRFPEHHVVLLRGKTGVFGVRLWRIVRRMPQEFELRLVPQLEANF